MCGFFAVARFAHIGGPPLGVRIAQTGDAVRRPRGSRSWSDGVRQSRSCREDDEEGGSRVCFRARHARSARFVTSRGTPIPSRSAAAAP